MSFIDLGGTIVGPSCDSSFHIFVYQENTHLITTLSTKHTTQTKDYHHILKWELMMPFSTGTGLERVGVVGPELDCWQTGL